MNQSSNDDKVHCPKCDYLLQANWFVCPLCGMRVKPGGDLILRSLMWVLLIGGFVTATNLIAAKDLDMATFFGVVFGLPLAIAFGSAVIFRVRGEPLSWRQLGKSAFRSFLFLIVAPTVVGVCLMIFAFIICFASIPFSR